MTMRTSIPRKGSLAGVVTLVAVGLVIGVAASLRATPLQADSAKAEEPQVKETRAEPAKAKTEAKASPEAERPGEAEVRALTRAVTKSYNEADAKGLAALFTEDATLIGSDGEEVRGRSAIFEQYSAAFGNGPTAKLEGKIKVVRLPTPDVATVGGEFRLTDEAGTTVAGGSFDLLAVRREGRWQLAEVRDHSLAEADSPEAERPLLKLEWMVGDWVDEEEDCKISSSVRWADGKRFLVQTYTVQVGGKPVTGGIQWIGWDPQADQVRSWVFDAGGGFGQGTWTNAGNTWVIKASGVLRDGRSNSATQFIERVNKDAVKIYATDLVVGDEGLPDLEEVVMVRKPPEPGPSDKAPGRGDEAVGKSAPKSPDSTPPNHP